MLIFVFFYFLLLSLVKWGVYSVGNLDKCHSLQILSNAVNY